MSLISKGYTEEDALEIVQASSEEREFILLKIRDKVSSGQ